MKRRAPQPSSRPKTPARPPAPSIAELGSSLDPLLVGMIDAHERWLAAIAMHRDAMRRGDGSTLDRAVGIQQAIMSEIAALEQRRAALVENAAPLAPRPTADHGRPITLRDLACVLPEPLRTRLTDRATTLRGLVEAVQRETAILRACTNAMLAHIEGLARRVGRRLSHAGTYGRRGVVEACGAAAATVDLRS